MRLTRLFVILTVTLGSCRNTTAPDLGLLVGEWADTPYVDQGGHSYQGLLSIRADRSYTTDFRISAAAGVGSAGGLIGYSISEGSFAVRHDSLFLHPALIRTWDRDINGGRETVTQVDYAMPRLSQPDRSGSRYDVSGETLRLHYLSYPADAAVETEATYFRVR